MAGSVPLIIGESDRQDCFNIRYARKKGINLVNIDANLLKRGKSAPPTVIDGRRIMPPIIN